MVKGLLAGASLPHPKQVIEHCYNSESRSHEEIITHTVSFDTVKIISKNPMSIGHKI